MSADTAGTGQKGIPYTIRVRESVPPKAGVKGFGRLVVDVVRTSDGKVTSTYEGNYSTPFKTFAPFKKAGREFALYSPHYTCTRVMELPSGRDLGGEEPNSFGFCPTEYAVPTDDAGELRVPYAFVSGCIWGDDSTWKIQLLDLNGVEDGKLARDERFGYITLPDKVSLADAVQVLAGKNMIDEDWSGAPPKWIARIAVQKWFDLESGAEILWEHNQARPAQPPSTESKSSG